MMMSDELKGNVPVLENDEVLGTAFVVTVEGWIANPEAVDGHGTSSIVGALRSVLFAAEPEVEFRVRLQSAFDVVEANNLMFTSFTIQQQDKTVELKGPLTVASARISQVDSDNDPDRQMCVLTLSLRRPAKKSRAVI